MNLRLAKSELISNAFLGEADKVVLLVTSRDFILRMEQSKIQKTILKWASHRHKPTKAIRQSICHGIGHTVTGDEFSTAFLELHSNGLVTSYTYDRFSAVYASIDSPKGYNMDMLYWLAT